MTPGYDHKVYMMITPIGFLQGERVAKCNINLRRDRMSYTMSAVQTTASTAQKKQPNTKALQNESSEHRANRLQKMREYRARNVEKIRERDRAYRRSYYRAHIRECAIYAKGLHARRRKYQKQQQDQDQDQDQDQEQERSHAEQVANENEARSAPVKENAT